MRWAFMACTRLTFEDAYISLRYAENLASGLGLVYNPGEKVFGASTPLYVLFLAALVKAGLPALTIARALTAIADGVTLYLWGSWLLRKGAGTREAGLRALLVFALYFGLSPLVVEISVSGMETSFALLLLSLALLGVMEERPLRCGAALGFLMLVRPDGALAAGVLLGFLWWQKKTVPWKPALLAALLPLPWIVFAWWYYGSPIPHSIVAKAAAYNLHRTGFFTNLRDTWSQVGPLRGSWGQWVASLALVPCLLLGLAEARRTPRLLPLALLLAAWWAYLVLPNTLLFRWYYPPLLLPAYVLAAAGFAGWAERPGRVPAALRAFWEANSAGVRLRRWGPVLAGAGLAGWLFFAADRASLLHSAEQGVRQAIGVWLREHTASETRIAAEPIGYIGYYSRRPLLDEVGLVSPEMVPLNQGGAGWFARMIADYRPEYVVERPGYLLRNRTINTGVPMFRTAAEREAFLAEYEAVAAFADTQLPRFLIHDYRFVIYARRSPQDAERWRERWARLGRESQGRLLCRAIVGSVSQEPHTAAQPAPRRQQ